MALEPKLAGLAGEFANVVARRIDIGKGPTEAARQLREEYNPAGIPYLRIYDPEGRFVGEVVGGNLAEIRRLIQPHARK